MFSFNSIKEYHIALQSGEASISEAVRFYINNIKAKQHLNAFLETYEEEALTRAQELEANPDFSKKLYGVVVGIKDVICYANHKVGAASKILEGFESLYSATAVEKLLAEGAIIIGRQNCDEFAMGSASENSAYGAVKNALDENRVPGGSSGGSAVAVQADLCMISLGSDTGGSVRQPADFCGIVGLKPSYGRVSRHGLLAYASSFDQIGILTKNIDDAALTLEVISGSDEYDSTLTNEKVENYSQLLDGNDDIKRIAYFKECLEHPGLDPEIKSNFEAFTKRLTENGYVVEPVDFQLLDYIVPTYYILTTAEASSNYSRYDGVRFGHRTSTRNVNLNEMYKQSRSEGFGKEVQRRIMLGTFVLSEGYFDAYFTKAQQVRRLLQQHTSKVFEKYDAILLPTVPTTAFELNKVKNPIESFLADIYTVYANLVGIPAISIPKFKHSNNMPYGLQLMTSHLKELPLLRLSKKLSAINPS